MNFAKNGVAKLKARSKAACKISLNFSKQKGFKKKLIESTIFLGTKNLNKKPLNFSEKITDYFCELLVRKKTADTILTTDLLQIENISGLYQINDMYDADYKYYTKLIATKRD